MAGFLNLGVALKRLGVKGEENQFRIVPGVFPTMQATDIGGLVARPKVARALASWSNWVAVGQTARWMIGGPSDISIKGIYLQSTRANLVWRIGTQLMPLPVLTSKPVDFGELPCVGGLKFDLPNPGAAGQHFAYGTRNFDFLNWFIPGGSVLAVNIDAAPGGLAAVCGAFWEQLPVPPAEA